MKFLLFLQIFFLNRIGQANDIHFEHLSLKDGLSQNSVYSILQDNSGFLWFATEDGLNRYDGYTFTVFLPGADDRQSISDNFIWTVMKDRNGHIWIGTNGGGLNHYDPGQDVFTRYFSMENGSNCLSNNDVRAICEDISGNIWVGTFGGGLDKINVTNGLPLFSHFKYDATTDNTIGSDNIYALCADTDGNIWIGTGGGGLSCLILNRDNKPQYTIKKYLHDSRNIHSLSHDDVRSIYQDRYGILWIGTWGGGLNRVIRSENGAFVRFKVYRYNADDPASLADDHITTINEDRSGNLWIGTENGLSCFDRKKDAFVTYLHNPDDPNSLSLNRIYSIFEDRSGVFWVGTRGAGLNKCDRNRAKFILYSDSDTGDGIGLSTNFIWSLYVEKIGNQIALWLGTNGGGLNKLMLDALVDPYPEYKNYLYDSKNPGSLSHNDVRSILRDRRGNLWVGTWGGGLNKMLPSNDAFVSYQHHPDDNRSLSQDDVRVIFEDRSGVLWIGTRDGGMNKMVFSDKKDTDPVFIRYRYNPSDPHSISHNYVYDIIEDYEGVLWIATWGGGLNKFDRNREIFTSYKHNPYDPASLSQNLVLTLYEDSRRNLWVGTSGGGLNKFNREDESFTIYNEKDGLPNDVIYSILEDDHENLWISTNRGLSRFNPQTGIFKNYDVSDGLQSNEFNGGAGFKTRNGIMYFAGINGCNVFYPDSVHDNLSLPSVVITDFQIFNQSVHAGEKINNRVILKESVTTCKEITLSYRETVFSFEFAALHYASPEQNQYAYMMEGIDKDWIYVNNRRFVTYTHLPAGRYIFRVKASNNDGVWNENGAAIRLVITPPFWKTWWFVSMMIVIVLGLIFSWYEMRIGNIRKHREELEIQVVERTKEINTQKEELSKINKALNKEIKIRRKTEEKISKSLKEKEILLKEIHHRVKNNLAVISSLLNLQSKYIENEKDLEVFRISQNRVQMIALIHEKLYKSKDLASVDFSVYIKELVDTLYRSYSIDPSRIRLNLDVEGVSLAVDRAIPCGLIVNELISNALKHAFPPSTNGKGTLTISLRPIKEKRLQLIVKDNGIGIPEGIDIENTESLGLKLVNILVEDQLNGDIQIVKEKGTEFRIYFDISS